MIEGAGSDKESGNEEEEEEDESSDGGIARVKLEYPSPTLQAGHMPTSGLEGGAQSTVPYAVSIAVPGQD